ncbi:MAG TPA: hypothetical protein VIW67_26295 [Terriglobales bacterium]|jgi:hypothetical protein
MTTKVQVGTIFIEDRPLIMRPLNLESEPYSGNWGVLPSFTKFSLNEKVRGAGWTCVPLAGEMKATVFGSLAAQSIRRALKQIFLEVREPDFNCLEITKIVEDRLLGMARTTVWVSSRHIQQGSIMQMVDEKQKTPRMLRT